MLERITIGVLWHSPEADFTESAQNINSKNDFEKYSCRITSTSPRSQWVNFYNPPGFSSHHSVPHCYSMTAPMLALASLSGQLAVSPTHIRADSRFALSQWETSLQSNDVSHWLGANLESALPYAWPWMYCIRGFGSQYHRDFYCNSKLMKISFCFSGYWSEVTGYILTLY